MGSTAGIHGSVNVNNTSGSSQLSVDDSSDTTGRTANLYNGELTGLGASAPIYWTPTSSATGGVTYLAVHGGSGGNTFDVENTSNLYDGTYIGSGSGGNTTHNSVEVYATSGSLAVDGGTGFQSVDVGVGLTAGIAGSVDVYNSSSSGYSYLTVDDSSDTTGRTANLYDGELTGLGASAPVYWSPSASSTGGVTFVDAEGGSGGNTFYVHNTSSPYCATIIQSGSGGNTTSNSVYVYATTGSLDVDGIDSFQSVDVGVGSTAGIAGLVNLQNTGLSGYSYLTVDDSLDTTGRTANLHDGYLTGLGASAPIEWSPSPSLTGGTTYVAVDGGSGGNTFNVYGTDFYYYTYLLTGGGSNTVDVTATNGALQINGSGTDTLVGPNVASTWTISSSNAGSVGNITFAGVANLTGGSANDIFNFSNGKGVTGIVNGGAGTNTLNYSAYTTGVTVDLTAGTATGTGGVVNIQNVTGSPANDSIKGNSASNVIAAGGGNDKLSGGPGGNDTFILAATQGASTTVTGAGTGDTLQGANIANTWNVTGANAGNVNGIAFTGIANLTGGTAADTFKFTSAGSVSGKINGGGGTNTLDYSADGGVAATVNLATGAATKTGGLSSITKLVGSSSTADTLVGPNAANTWTISGINSGTVGTFTFSAVENLTGGTGNDTFKFTAGSVTGKINGGGGTNTLDYSGDGGVAVTVNLATGAATRTGGFSNIQALVGSSAADTLVGPNSTNTWTLTTANAGTVGTFKFSAVENLTGGSAEDVFVFDAGVTISGKINGGGGNNWLDYAAYTTAVTVNLATDTATGINGSAAGGISSIRNVRGSQGSDILTGNSQGNILIGRTGTNTIKGGTGRSILIGGKGKDTVTGGSGNDILIAGYTDFNNSSLANDLALDSILAEWQSGNSYSTRISHIKNGGGLNGSNKFDWGVTVHDNSTSNANKLTGADEPGALNWFFANVSHTTTNKSAGEQLN